MRRERGGISVVTNKTGHEAFEDMGERYIFFVSLFQI